VYPGDQYGYDGRRARRARRQQAAAAQASGAVQETPAATANESAAPRRWVPRISNPFSNIRLPGRGRQAAEAPVVGDATATPQLESVVVR
jgi:hypothetical protein